MKIKLFDCYYTINTNGVPDKTLWNRGWTCSLLCKVCGFYIIKYEWEYHGN